ncbi:MAG: hypothetical protein QW350_05645 [Candidatus Aenigmatarchaeota archaeon]|jgi:hypothetical protein
MELIEDEILSYINFIENVFEHEIDPEKNEAINKIKLFYSVKNSDAVQRKIQDLCKKVKEDNMKNGKKTSNKVKEVFWKALCENDEKKIKFRFFVREKNQWREIGKEDSTNAIVFIENEVWSNKDTEFLRKNFIERAEVFSSDGKSIIPETDIGKIGEMMKNSNEDNSHLFFLIAMIIILTGFVSVFIYLSFCLVKYKRKFKSFTGFLLFNASLKNS